MQTPLHLAAARGNVVEMQYWLDRGIPIDSRDRHQHTPLHFAVYSPNPRLAVEFLVNNKCDLDVRDSAGQTALMIAVHRAYTDVAQLLIESGADVNCCDVRNWNALHFACSARIRKVEIVKLLVDKVSDINAATNNGKTALSLELSEYHLGGGNKDIVELLIKSGVSCGRESSRWTLLHCAADKGWLDIVEILVNKYDINAKTLEAGVTPLILAVRNRHYDVVDLLIKHGADIYLKDNDNKAALCRALPNVKLSTLLVNSGAYLEYLDDREIRNCILCTEHILKNRELSTQIVINEYNNLHLPRVYQKYSSKVKLPLIDSLKIKSKQCVVSEIERSVDHEIQTKKFCNVMEVRPLVLQMLAVRSLIAI